MQGNIWGFLNGVCVTWIHAYLNQADKNHDDKMSYNEVRTLLQMINIDLSDQYALSLFQVTFQPESLNICLSQLDITML